jgi:peptidoglycan/xylan/chitin deacetylase (PgdA/CDA1 family)
MYHRFTGGNRSLESALCRQFAYIRRHYHPVSLSDVVSRWQAGQPLPARALAITVDDGYADFQCAWPLLKAFQLPATLFVVSGFVNRDLWLWPDVVQFCLSRSPLSGIRLDLPDGSCFERSLQTAPERRAADADLDASLLAMPDEFRRDVIARLPQAARTPLPVDIPSEYLALSWEDLKKMASEGLEVGAHTETHPVLARISSPGLLQREVAGSKRAIEDRLNLPVRHFCYPNGQIADFNAASVDAVRAAGFLSATTALRGLVNPGDSPWELRRIGIDPLMSNDTFELELAGFRMV